MKIGIVNDTLMAAQVIAMVLEKSGKHDVLWTVANGAEAITRCVQQQPDLILMDLVMPGLNGAETTREILKRCSVAVLVVTASVGTNCSLAFQAMGAGALDVIATPTLNNQAGQEAFLRKIGQIQAIISTAQEPAPSPPVCRPDDLSCGGDGTAGRLVAIGCSAGGPTALSEILSSLPPLPDTAVVLVQHIDQRFVGELVQHFKTNQGANLGNHPSTAIGQGLEEAVETFCRERGAERTAPVNRLDCRFLECGSDVSRLNLKTAGIDARFEQGHADRIGFLAGGTGQRQHAQRG
jgi:chemotaxis response regulator CheB